MNVKITTYLRHIVTLLLVVAFAGKIYHQIIKYLDVRIADDFQPATRFCAVPGSLFYESFLIDRTTKPLSRSETSTQLCNGPLLLCAILAGTALTRLTMQPR